MLLYVFAADGRSKHDILLVSHGQTESEILTALDQRVEMRPATSKRDYETYLSDLSGQRRIDTIIIV